MKEMIEIPKEDFDRLVALCGRIYRSLGALDGTDITSEDVKIMNEASDLKSKLCAIEQPYKAMRSKSSHHVRGLTRYELATGK